MSYPAYSFPAGLIAGVARDIILLRRRDFHTDAKVCIARLHPPLQVLGRENIPEEGPCVITVNHYHRQGFRAEWLTLGIAALVPIHVHWIMTAEFTYPGKWYAPLAAPCSRILLRRIAYIYGFTNMPPMPPRLKDVEARARSVRAVLKYVMQTQYPVLGLAPEGYDPPGPSGVLTRPAPGVGRFGLQLARTGLRFVPVGAYEARGAFHLHFGTHYELSVHGALSVEKKDECAARTIMEKIACLLPSHLQGEFA